MGGPSWFLLAGVVASGPAGARGRIGVGLWLWFSCVSVVFTAAFQIAEDFLASLDIINFNTKPQSRMGIYVVKLFLLSPWWSVDGCLHG